MRHTQYTTFSEMFFDSYKNFRRERTVFHFIFKENGKSEALFPQVRGQNPVWYPSMPHLPHYYKECFFDMESKHVLNKDILYMGIYIVINTNKTKIKIFQGSNHSYSNFFYKKLSLAEVKEYNFLGNIIDNKGRFKRSAQELSKKGLKAFFSLKKILVRIFTCPNCLVNYLTL